MLVWIVYCIVHFLEANTIWGTWTFDVTFKNFTTVFLGYMTIDLLGGDVVELIRIALRFTGIIKKKANVD